MLDATIDLGYFLDLKIVDYHDASEAEPWNLFLKIKRQKFIWSRAENM